MILLLLLHFIHILNGCGHRSALLNMMQALTSQKLVQRQRRPSAPNAMMNHMRALS